TASAARSRTKSGLVQLRRDQAGGGGLCIGVLPVRHAHADRAKAVHPAGPLQGSKLPDRQYPDLPGRHRAVRDARAVTAAVAGSHGIFGIAGRHRYGAARRRHVDRHAVRGSRARTLRCAVDHRHGCCPDRDIAVDDVALLDATAHGPITGAAAKAALNQQVTAQATMIAYLDDFYFMLLLTLLAIPLLLLVRTPRGTRAGVKDVALE